VLDAHGVRPSTVHDAENVTWEAPDPAGHNKQELAMNQSAPKRFASRCDPDSTVGCNTGNSARDAGASE
jgi:hypothetical protein